MRVGITGGAGFIGSHVVDILMYHNIEPIVIDDFSTGKQENLEHDLEIRKKNLLYLQETRDALEGIDVLIHLANKIGGIGYFHRKPAFIISNNDLINRNVFDVAKDNGIQRVIYAGSSMAFENTTHFPTKEEDLKGCTSPNSSYGFAKLNGEYYCRAFKKEFNLDYTVLRPFNAVGTREYPGETIGRSHVIPDFAYKMLVEKQYPLEIFGSGLQTRSFTNVKDVARAFYLALIKKMATNNDFNIGTDEETTIYELAERMWNIAKCKHKMKLVHLPAFDMDVQRRVPDYTKAFRLLGWKPRYRLSESLKEYMDWYREVVMC